MQEHLYSECNEEQRRFIHQVSLLHSCKPAVYTSRVQNQCTYSALAELSMRFCLSTLVMSRKATLVTVLLTRFCKLSLCNVCTVAYSCGTCICGIVQLQLNSLRRASLRCTEPHVNITCLTSRTTLIHLLVQTEFDRDMNHRARYRDTPEEVLQADQVKCSQLASFPRCCLVQVSHL